MRIAIAALIAFSTLWCTGSPLQDPKPDPGRAGTVVDRQGTALVRPVGRERWTPLWQRSPLFAGDQVRTEARGANAVELTLMQGASLVLGPGSLLEVEAGDALQLLRGEIEVAATAAHPVKVRGPAGFTATLQKKTLLRATEAKTEPLLEAPRWLTGYRASTTDEWMGSLLANVDGRQVALAVGYHKVEVVIRDQIAQTTIEESFVNQTEARLEGQFRFPLPADASISGFGMWIGNELVEADIVEKQRARQIYETILRERRDPGLLEWSGGNLFTARVFPIEAHSEKRIRLRYTQVLPLVGNTLTYRYALKSELLRQNPLRQLAIKVACDSTLPLQDAVCTSHAVRARKTAQQAVLEYDASEVTPERDFEARFTLDRTSPLALIPHRRGSDGYFMLLVQPPDAASAGLVRELLPERGPLHLLVLADTSGSMDAAARGAQQQVLAGLLAQLSPKDQFELWTCDVNVRRLADAPLAAGDQSRAQALEFLAARSSLGWTDLDAAFTEVAARAAKGTTVVYLGDGIGTSGDGDPQALTARLRALLQDKGLACHAIHPGSTFEAPVLDAIASCGGGSVRAVGDDPIATAYALLAEAAQPVVKDLRLELEGLRTARVYPARLPNLAAGAQQIVLGRYLPTGTDQTGKITLTGTLDGKPLRYATTATLRDQEEGNSFLPRLWARRHLDALLALGGSAGVQAEIIAFSIEYGILTPFTSLLVLETDADRERFGVERRVKMRDGEQFFAEAKDKAALEILRQQMQVARNYRLQLKARMLREIARLGKDLHAGAIHLAEGRQAGGWGPSPERAGSSGYRDDLSGFAVPKSAAAVPLDGDSTEREAEPTTESELEDAADLPHERLDDEANAKDEESHEYFGRVREKTRDAKEGKKLLSLRQEYSRRLRGNESDLRSLSLGWKSPGAGIGFGQFGFPWLGKPVTEPAVPDPKWDAEILAALHALDRRKAIAGLGEGLSLVSTSRQLHAVRKHVTHSYRTAALVGTGGWWVEHSQDGVPTLVHALVAGVRSVVSRELRLGRRRPAAADELTLLQGCGLPLEDLSLQDFVRTYAGWKARVLARDGATLDVEFALAEQTVRLTIDTARRVLVELASFRGGALQARTRGSGFVQVAGQWFATRTERRDHKDRIVYQQDLRVQIPAGGLAPALAAASAPPADTLFAPAEDPELASAKQARLEQKAGFAEHFRAALHYAATGQWEECLAIWKDAKSAAGTAAALPWLEMQLQNLARRPEEGKRLAGELAGKIADAELSILAPFLAQQGAAVLAASEQHELWQRLAPRPGHRGSDAAWFERAWTAHEAQLLAQLGRHADARTLRTRLWQTNSDDFGALRELLEAHLRLDDAPAALALIESVLKAPERWDEGERDHLFTRWLDLLFGRAGAADLVTIAERWMTAAPANEGACLRWLSALLFAGKEATADAWLAAHLLPLTAEATPTSRAQLGAAIWIALGSGWNFQTQQADDRWLTTLGDVALSLARGDDPNSLASRVLHDWRFSRTDAAARLRQQLRTDLTAPGAIAAMPLDRLGRYLAWIPWSRTDVDIEVWTVVSEGLRARWAATTDREPKRTLAAHLLSLLDAHGEGALALALLRELVQDADDPQRPSLAQQLGQRLAQEPWTEAIEQELVALIPLATRHEVPGAQHALLADHVRWLAEQLERMRTEAALPPVAEREKLSRAELKTRTTAARAASRTALATRFLQLGADADPLARPWFALERACWLAELAGDWKAREGEAREVLTAALQLPADDPTARLLRERAVLVLSHVAVHRRSPADLTDRAVKTLEDLAGTGEAAFDARHALFRLLVALDRGAATEQHLRAWIVPGKVASEWRRALGYLLAERGKLDEAIQVFAATQQLDELDATDYAALAAWHLVRHEDALRVAALRKRYQVMGDHELSSWLWHEQNRVARRGDAIPESLNPETMLVLAALLTKTSSPAQWLSHPQQLYAATKDHRLLACLADGVVGHTTGAIYPFLTQVGSMLSGVHEEATCDAVLAEIQQRATAAPSPVDRRALTLLEMLVARRAAEVGNQRAPHVARALKALQAAFRGDWQQDERSQMAQLLTSLGRLPEPALASEQRTQLERLLQDEREPRARLAIATCLGQVLAVYGQMTAAIDTVEIALREHATTGRSADERHASLFTLVAWLSAGKRFAAAEVWLQQESTLVAGSLHPTYVDRLDQLGIDCLREDGSLARGHGAALYGALREELAQRLFRCAPGQRERTLTRFLEVHMAAHKRGFPAARDLRAFAAAQLEEVLSLAPMESGEWTHHVARCLREIAGPKEALRCMLHRLAKEPRWLVRTGRDTWSQGLWDIAQWRGQAGGLGELDKPLLGYVLRELERDLVALEQRSSSFYDLRQSYCWREKAGEFLTVARRVVEVHASSPARVLACAQYLYWGLERKSEAIDVLLAAAARSALEANGRETLVEYLFEQRRWRDAVPHLDLLIAARPDHTHFRWQKVKALHHLGQDAAARTWLAATEKLLKEQKRWIEPEIAAMAATCLEVGFDDAAAAAYEELVALHARTHPARGVGDGTLAHYYGQLGQAYVRLGKLDQAVAAASAAVVAWGRNDANQQQAVAALHAVLTRLPDLAARIAICDAEAERTGQDAPLLRKLLGRICLERRDFARARTQLLLARDLQPTDTQTQELLLKTAQALGDKALVATTLERLGRFDELGRFLGTSAEAERAWTNLVEHRFDDALAHQTLAQHREEQNRLQDAIGQWRHVVRIRALEPQGWLALAKAQLRAGLQQDARATLEHVLTHTWEERFGDVKRQAAELLK